MSTTSQAHLLVEGHDDVRRLRVIRRAAAVRDALTGHAAEREAARLGAALEDDHLLVLEIPAGGEAAHAAAHDDGVLEPGDEFGLALGDFGGRALEAEDPDLDVLRRGLRRRSRT
jgi:hypothetical protein